MRTRLTLLVAGLGSMLITMFAGCSGTGNALGPATPPSAPMQRQSTRLNLGALAERLGAPPGTRLAIGVPMTGPTSHGALVDASLFKGLYAADIGVQYGTGGVLQLSPGKYKEVGKMVDGMSTPDGEWVDRSGNFYVANVNGGNVTEYSPGGMRPACTYSGLSDPINVKTDDHGNVFAVDWNIGHQGHIFEYRQCKDAIVKTYGFGANAPIGLAFNKAGDMFVTYVVQPRVTGALEKFPAGSTNPTQLGATFVFPGGLVIDKNQNLIAADQGTSGQTNGAIDIIAPPYSTATPLVSGLAEPIWLSLNKRETNLFASSLNWSPPTDWVFNYPSGSLRTTIGASNGLLYPLGVADAPDATL